MIEIDRYTVAEGQAAQVTVFSSEPITAEVTGPDGRSNRIDAGEASDGVSVLLLTCRTRESESTL